MSTETKDTRDESPWRYTIGIVGGMGPHSHIELERLLLKHTTKLFSKPVHDQVYPPWIVSSIPQTPDRTSALVKQEVNPLPWLKQSIANLSADDADRGADFALIACNTAHAYYDELQRQVKIPILNMVQRAVSQALSKASKGPTVGILATTGTLRCGIYHQVINRMHSEALVISLLDKPEGSALQERLVMEPIYGRLENGRRDGGIKAGAMGQGNDYVQIRDRIGEAIDILDKSGCDVIISGCSELSIALNALDLSPVKLIDSLTVSAEAALHISLGEQPLPSNGSR